MITDNHPAQNTAVARRAIKLGRKPLMQQGSPKRNPESKAAFESNQKMAILEFARISKSQVFPSLIAVLSHAIFSTQK
jgi:hypothetical protein